MDSTAYIQLAVWFDRNHEAGFDEEIAGFGLGRHSASCVLSSWA